MPKAIRNSFGYIVLPSTDIEPFGPESCLKPVGDLAKVIQATSPGDMLLFMIAMDKKEKGKKN
jgi:hypothetical protein